MTPARNAFTRSTTYQLALQQAVGRYEDLVRSLSLLRGIDSIDDLTEPFGLVCRRIVELISQHSFAENCSLMALNVNRTHLELWATVCSTDDTATYSDDVPLKTSFELGRGIAGLVAVRGLPMRVSDAPTCQAYVPLPSSTARSLMCLPLTAQGLVLGVLNLSHSTIGFFTQDDEATMLTVADRAGRLLASHQLLQRHRVAERCYQLACEQAGDGIVVLDEDRNTIIANSVAERLLGVELGCAQTPTHSWLDRIHEEDRPALLKSRADLWRTGGACTSLYRVVLENGEVRHIEEHATLFDGLNNHRISVCVLRDVSARVAHEHERTALEAQLRHAQKMEALGELAGGITHDFNNILTGILANASLARASGDATGLPELLADIEAAAHQGAAMTRRLLAMSRRSKVERATVDVSEIINDVLAILRNTLDRRVRLRRSYQTGLWRVRVDRSQVHQVLLNLCVNARDALAKLPPGGNATISVTAANVQIDQSRCSIDLQARAGDYVCISVTDTGPGVPHEIRSRIFEPFFTTRERDGGTGLGLAIAYGVAQRHGGWLDVESNRGAGATFQFYLPRSERTESIRAAPLPASHRTVGNATALVVDDDDIMRRTARRLLAKLGVDVITARDGVEAVDLFSSAKERIDVVLLDLNMPRMNGDEALIHIRKMNPYIPVIISSGHTRAVDDDGLDPNAPLTYLEKPYTLRMLAEALDRILVRAGE